MTKQDGRGCPRKFELGDRVKLAALIREHGLRGARTLSHVPISLHTLTHIAREFDIRLKHGRRPTRAVQAKHAA